MKSAACTAPRDICHGEVSDSGAKIAWNSWSDASIRSASISLCVRAALQRPDGGQETAHVSYLIACDGAHSPVRHALGVSFFGDDYPTDFMTADVQVDWKLPRDQHAFFFAAEGMLAFFPLPSGRATLAADIGPAQGDHPPLGEPALEDLP